MRGGLASSGRSISLWCGAVRRRLCAPRSGGYTVLEVLIVLAVTAILFVSAAAMIAGRQNRTAFEQAVRDVHSRIEQVINEVATGFYPNMGNFNCTVTGSNAPVISGTTGAAQGTNSDCIFMGKAIQFQVSSTDPEQFKIYTLVGRRLSSSNPGAEATSLATARPVVIAPSTSLAGVPDNSVTEELQNGLTTVFMKWGPGATDTSIVAFSQSLAQYSGGQIQSGSQHVDVIPLGNSSGPTTLGMTQQQAAERLNTNLISSTANPADGVRICFVSGGSEQSGLITIGGTANRELAVQLDIKSNRTCTS